MTIIEKVKKIITIVVVINILIIISYLLIMDYPKSPLELIKLNATLAFLSIGVVLSIKYYLWKIPYVNKIFGSIPNIEGVWNAEIVNTNDNKKQKSQLIIKQTWFTVQVISKTKRGNSTTISSEIIHNNDNYKLYFNWSASFNGVPFNGTTIVDIIDNELDGYYFSNSNFDGWKCTSGSFKAKKLIKTDKVK
jgi:hypothetical protein